jgi:hypothetical protein
MSVPYKICIEPKEYKQYSAVINPDNIITLPKNFSELGQGGIPVRNWVWNHAKDHNTGWHWILDDNIEKVVRYNNNLKIPCKTGTPFKVIEDFVARYDNISQAGMHYDTFCPAGEARAPIQLNNRVYSCILLRNDTGYQWRGKYNEDTDLSLRMLKDGWCTVLFRQFLIDKRCTMAQSGGNTDTIYNEGDERREFAESLQRQHPDLVKVVRRFNRWHHQVNYKPFYHNRLKRNKTIFKAGINEYDFKLIKVKKESNP